jgi:hypothetical protein
MPGNSSRRTRFTSGSKPDFCPRQKAKGECRSGRLSCTQRCFFCCLRLKQRHSCMVQKSLAGRRQLNTVSAAIHQLNADFLVEIPDLPAERWLRSVERLLGGNGQTACISHGDEVAQMSSITISHVSQAWAQLTKSFSSRPEGSTSK